MAPRCLAALAALTFLLPAVAGAKGSRTLAEALVPHVGAGGSPEVLERNGSRVTVIIREDGVVVADVDAHRTRRGWFVLSVTRCTGPH